MEGFDDGGVFFSDNFGADDPQTGAQINLQSIKRKFKEFLRQFHEGNFNFKYRDSLKRQYNLGQYFLEVNLEDLASFDENLADKMYKQPTEHLPVFEEAAKEVADELTAPRPEGEEHAEDIQVLLSSDGLPSSLRELKSGLVSRLVKIPGIIVSASGMRSKATQIAIQCRSCRSVIPNLPVKPGLDGYVLPRKCNTEQAGRPKCPLDPYFIMPDKCTCVNFQTLKLQELTDSIPQGEMPRHLQLYSDRYLCERVTSGNRVVVLGIFSIKKVTKTKSVHAEPGSRSLYMLNYTLLVTWLCVLSQKNAHFRQSSNKPNPILLTYPGASHGRAGVSGREKSIVGVRAPYIRVVGVEVFGGSVGTSPTLPVTPDQEELFRRLASSTDIYERIARSIAPSIYGSADIKKAIACLLFGGSRKRMPDGLTRRGDINVLLLGDPGTAKSQLLKFVERVSPVGVYTSGKGSSAAGLTASVIRDPNSRNFVMEGGAMVLADGGVVCIDEFDKMREDDRVAIHEAMEQQTISIAKAGITTTLNSRCSVLAAANSVFGRWDDAKGDENIDFMPTILSRFDMIFIVKDEHDEKRDMTLAKHIMHVHMTAGQATEDSAEGELSLQLIKKFINYCRTRCGPRLSVGAGEKLKHRYVLMRSGARQHELDADKRLVIPITVRYVLVEPGSFDFVSQLEAVIRIAESLAKMQLQAFATETHIDEALRLFQVSTLDAATSGTLAGAEGFTTDEDYEILQRIEKQLKRRFAIGSQVSEHNIVQDFVRQKYPERAIFKVLYTMIRRGELQHRMQRKMLYRLQ